MNSPELIPNITPEMVKQLATYAELLREWNPRINLVAPGTLSTLEERHIADSAQLVPHIPLPSQRILDVGSGAGLPGLILAILAPQHSYTLVERDQRKVAFLQTAVFRLGLPNVTVLNIDVRDIKNQFDIVTCRAFASLLDILTYTSPLLVQGGAWLLLKGRGFDEELSVCETSFHLTTQRWPSKVPGEGWVVQISRK